MKGKVRFVLMEFYKALNRLFNVNVIPYFLYIAVNWVTIPFYAAPSDVFGHCSYTFTQ